MRQWHGMWHGVDMPLPVFVYSDSSFASDHLQDAVDQAAQSIKDRVDADILDAMRYMR